MIRASRVIPMLSVADLPASLQFYSGVLGGQQVYQFPPVGDAVFVILRFGGTEFGIGLLSSQPLHGVPQRSSCINVPDADSAVAALSAIGAKTVMAPVDLPWSEAYVEDHDGNLVMLAASSAEP